MECADVTYCSASAVNSGNPTTTPSATINKGTSWLRAGRFSLNSNNRHRARMAARVARATVRNTGSNSSTATRVAGSEPLKITTPIRPLIHPRALLSSAGFCTFEVRSIWLTHCWVARKPSYD
ncbi:hypothetical protein D3C72_2021580 [compost metagenome]